MCSRIGKSRSWLSDVENGLTTATPGELARVSSAIDSIIADRERVRGLAASAGLSLAGVRL